MIVIKELSNEIELTIRFSELDPLGVVWHGNYFKFFEDGRDALGNQYGLNYLHMHERGLVVPIVKCSVDYKSSIYYHNRIKVVTTYHNTAAAKIVHRYEVWNLSTGKLSAKGETIQVFTDTAGNLIMTNPDFFLDWKKQNGLL